jgi:hypothetical protein
VPNARLVGATGCSGSSRAHFGQCGCTRPKYLNGPSTRWRTIGLTGREHISSGQPHRPFDRASANESMTDYRNKAACAVCTRSRWPWSRLHGARALTFTWRRREMGEGERGEESRLHLPPAPHWAKALLAVHGAGKRPHLCGQAKTTIIPSQHVRANVRASG